MVARVIEMVGQWNECVKKERMWRGWRVERSRMAQGEGEEVKGKKAKADGSMNEVGESKGNREAVKDKSWGSTLQLFLGSRCQDRQAVEVWVLWVWCGRSGWVRAT